MSLDHNFQEHALVLEAETGTQQQGFVGWRCPSNIALVKYWGKYKGQVPANPSVSFALEEAATQTTIDYKITAGDPEINFYFGGTRNLSFEKKILQYFRTVEPYFPFLSHTTMVISSHNSFPHSAGIASSASAMGALALCLCSIERALKGEEHDTDTTFFQKASFIARLGSGSAARSVYGGLALWGETDRVEGSSNEVAIPLREAVHESFSHLQDAILLVDSSEKKISSTQGHAFMDNHPYALQRFDEARKNVQKLIKILQQGDWQAFFRLVEHEALSLHAMMMTSMPGYILLKPNTLEVIERVTKYRESYSIPCCFTLDAGANVHILYSRSNEIRVREIIENEFRKYCENEQVIFDHLGEGPQKLLFRK